MPALQRMYRLVLESAHVQVASEPATLEEVVAAFNERIASCAFRPDRRLRLIVLSEEAWQSRRSPSPPTGSAKQLTA